MSTPVKRSEKQLPSEANFRTFLPLNCSKFRLKQCERLQSELPKMSKKLSLKGSGAS